MGKRQAKPSPPESSAAICAPGVTVLCGPAGAGKTSAALDLYEQYLSQPTEPGCLLLAPNRMTVTYLRDLLLARSAGGVLVAPRIMTFAQLAGRLLVDSGVPHRAISPIRRRALLEGIVDELAGRKQLSALHRVADTPGLVAALDRTIAELKRAAIEPETLRPLAGRSGVHADLLAVYAAYQGHLTTHELYDEEGQLWEARLQLARAADPTAWLSLRGLKALAVDGFTDFSPTQLEILRLLSHHVERLAITLPHSGLPAAPGAGETPVSLPTGQRRWSARQLARIVQVFQESCQVVHLPARPAGPCGDLLGKLFDLEASTTAAGWPEGIELVSAASLDGECRAIARWVKTHLAAGVAPHDLAIVARRVEPYQQALARVFDEAGIPAPASAACLAETPLGRFLTNLVALATGPTGNPADAFASADVMALISSSYFRPAALGEFDDRSSAAAQLIIRQGNVLSGRQSYAAAARRLAERVGKNGNEEDDELASPMRRHLATLGVEGINRGGALLEAVLSLVDPLAGGGQPADTAAHCRRALDALQLPQAAAACDNARLVAADLRSLASIRSVLEELGQLDDLPGGQGRWTARQFAEHLSAALSAVECPASRPAGAVRLASALDARAIRLRHLWLAGLNEGDFPAAATEGALLSDAQRRAWAGQQSQHLSFLDTRDDLISREMLLFYLTLARADQTLTLSWLTSDVTGRAMQRSHYVDELVRLAGPIEQHLQKLPPAEFAPPAQRLISSRELLNTALGELAAAGSTGPALAAARQLQRSDLRRLAGPLWAAHRRWRAAPADSYDGVLDDPALLSELAGKVPQLVFSVTQINGYLSCPWRYFAQYWLRLEPLAEPQEQLLPAQRGILIHAVLRRTIISLLQAGPVSLKSLQSDEAVAAMDAALAAERAAGERLGVTYPTLWQAELAEVRRAVLQYLDRLAESDVDGVVACAELGFGMGADGRTDPASIAEPLTLVGPSGPVRLRGKIDRVDRVQTEAGEGLFVVDYKSGQVPKLNEDVQLAAYVKAAEQALHLAGSGAGFHSVRVGKCEDRTIAAGRPARNLRPFEQWLADAIDRLHAAVAGIAAGNFNAIAPHDCAAASCPYRRICIFSEARALVKAGSTNAANSNE